MSWVGFPGQGGGLRTGVSRAGKLQEGAGLCEQAVETWHSNFQFLPTQSEGQELLVVPESQGAVGIAGSVGQGGEEEWKQPGSTGGPWIVDKMFLLS